MVRTRSPLHRRLRAETAGLHRRLEARLDLLGPALSRQRYREVVGVLLGFYAPVEAGLRVLDLEVPLGLALRDRAALLERDLRALDGSPGDAPRCVDLPPLVRREHAAGCLYVLEGACLGGQVAAPVLARRLALGPEGGAAFFTGEGPRRTAVRWRSFLSWLELPARGDEVVATACATFAALARWCEERLP